MDIKIAIKNILTVNKLFSRVKTPLKTKEKSNILYRIECNNCNKSYIGQTSRTLNGRIISHKSDCNRNIKYNIKKIPEKPNLLKLCGDLQLKLTVGSESDIDGWMLCDELISLKSFLPDQDDVTPIYILNFIKDHNIQELYPNVWIALRKLITIPVTVASGERSFSKLKLIKTYLRWTVSQSRSTNLATLSIENEIAETMDFGVLIREFADRIARKVKWLLFRSFPCFILSFFHMGLNKIRAP